jgi:hypothetical protein
LGDTARRRDGRDRGVRVDVFDQDLAWALFAGIVAAYVLSRGIAKAGSKEGPFILGRDAER